MNNKKIAFITCINDKDLYEENLRYINSLTIPEGFEIDLISIFEAESMTSAYNTVINNIDAKYKVYLHQDTLIINKNFINDILKVFEDKTVGMIGVVGAKNIPESGMWWEAKSKYGQVYESSSGKMKLLNFNEVNKSYEEVQGIDGLIMITQYDLPWKEDIFDGWDFYDISQSIEFILKGYKVIVPNQSKPWCIHTCKIRNKNNCEEYRKKFLKEYLKYKPINKDKIVGISTVKNEVDIIEDFVRYNLQYVDELYIIDNNSSDETKEILEKLKEEGLSLKIYSDSNCSHNQSEVITELAWRVKMEANPEYIIPLDADEFIVINSKKDLLDKLSSIKENCFGLIPWKTYVVNDRKNNDRSILMGMEYRRSTENPQYYKVVITKEFFYDSNNKIAQGSHLVTNNNNVKNYQIMVDIYLAHFPIRNMEQLMSKVLVGWSSYLIKNKDSVVSGGGYYWEKLYNKIMSGVDIDFEDLKYISKYYSYNEECNIELISDPIRIKFTRKYSEDKKTNPLINITKLLETFIETKKIL